MARGRILRNPRGESFTFDGGAVVVDFAHTGGPGRWAVFESLHRSRDLADWLAAPPLELPRSLAVSETDLVAARDVRNACLTLLQATAHQHPPPRSAVATVNRAAAAPPLIPRLTMNSGGGSGVGRRWARPVTVEAALSTLARELIEILAGPLAERVRECGGDNCGLVFVDTSRSGARRWCSMERCGNRHKVRAFRERDRDGDGDGARPGVRRS
jgi:predicted RNA-binding Zn ribbon-like protein